MNGKAILAILLIAILVAVAVAAIAAQLNIPNQGNINNPLTITIDGKDYSNATDTLEWGNMTWGNTYNKTMTLKNIANVNLTTCIITDEPAGTLMTWQGNNTLLTPQQNVTGTLALQVVDANVGLYNWNITVSANGT